MRSKRSSCSSRSTPSLVLPRVAGEETEHAPDLIRGGGLERFEPFERMEPDELEAHERATGEAYSWIQLGE